MSIAVDRNAVRVWVLNVGDLKPYERETEFFLTYAYDSTKWSAFNLDDFVTSWAKREFDVSDEDANSIATIVANVTRFNANRKPELLNSTLYSVTNYREASHAENLLSRLTDFM